MNNLDGTDSDFYWMILLITLKRQIDVRLFIRRLDNILY
jgi:hypothetical protein